jgi:hybrid polyketide synthase/nonribosomal peptide synthetase FtdB
MVDHGAVHLALMQRSALPPESEWDTLPEGGREAKQVAAVRSLESKGASVSVLSVDVGDEAQLQQCLLELKNGGELPVRGVVHAAGIVESQPTPDLDIDSLHRVLRPKVLGSWNLHRALHDEPLDFCVLFSSASSVLGSPFYGAYAAGNAFLDALAHYRHTQGHPAVSINWGGWSDVGMAARLQQKSDRDLTPSGMEWITPAQGVAALEHILARDTAQIGVIPMDWSRWGQTGVRFLADVMGEEIPASISRMRSQLITATPKEREQLLHTYLAETTATVMEVAASELDFQRPLYSFGLDSLMAVELTNRLRADLGVSLQVVELLEGSNLSELAANVLNHLSKGADDPHSDRVSNVLKKLNQMSDEEVEALLAQKKQAAQR